jgi:hypothetical protein
MSYCGLCDTHDVKLTYSKEGVECSNCGFDYHENIERDNAERTLNAIKRFKRDGGKYYPNDPSFGKPIDVALKDAEERCIKLGLKI